MKQVRIVLWLLVAVAAGVAGYMALNGTAPSENKQVTVLGGPFNLVSHKGEPLTREDLLGRPHALFFGFTNCPDICPTTLLHTAGWMKELGEDANKLDFYFFTVDPERDTPEIMTDYVNAFDSRIIGVTGDQKEMMKTVKAYRGYAKKVDLGDGEYTMDHSAFVMLFRADGSFQGTIAYEENNEAAIAKLKRLINNS